MKQVTFLSGRTKTSKLYNKTVGVSLFGTNVNSGDKVYEFEFNGKEYFLIVYANPTSPEIMCATSKSNGSDHRSVSRTYFTKVSID